jgi:hypothetical protein
MFDLIAAAPGISASSQGSGTSSLVSAFGSGANENTFLIDGTNFTSPANGVARAEPGIDFIQEIQIQSVGASAEYGNTQGAVVNVVTRQGGDRFLHDASYWQPADLTSQPVRLRIPGAGQRASGHERVRYRDFTTDLGGPVVRNRLWFFAAISICATTTASQAPTWVSRGPTSRTRIFAKLTWRLARRGSWFRAFTTSTGSTPRSRRR